MLAWAALSSGAAAQDGGWWHANTVPFRLRASVGAGYSTVRGPYFAGLTGGPGAELAMRLASRPQVLWGLTYRRQRLGVAARLQQPVPIGEDEAGQPRLAAPTWQVTLDEVFGGMTRLLGNPAGRWPHVLLEGGVGVVHERVRLTLARADTHTSETTFAVQAGAGLAIPLRQRVGLEVVGTVRFTGSRTAAPDHPVGGLFGLRSGLVLYLGGAQDRVRLQQRAALKALGKALGATMREETKFHLRVPLYGDRSINVVRGRGFEGALRAGPTAAQAMPDSCKVQLAQVHVIGDTLRLTVRADIVVVQPHLLRQRLASLSPAARALAESLFAAHPAWSHVETWANVPIVPFNAPTVPDLSTGTRLVQPRPPMPQEPPTYQAVRIHGILDQVLYWPSVASTAAREICRVAGQDEVTTTDVEFRFTLPAQQPVPDLFAQMWGGVFQEPCPLPRSLGGQAGR